MFPLTLSDNTPKNVYAFCLEVQVSSPCLFVSISWGEKGGKKYF